MADRWRRGLATAFTLIELVIVIAVIGILAAIAIPRFVDLRTQADTAAEEGTVGAVRSGILLITAQNTANKVSPARPTILETEAFSVSADCTVTNDATGCFDIVLEPSVSGSSWSRTKNLQYQHTRIGGGTQTYTYNASTGAFTSP